MQQKTVSDAFSVITMQVGSQRIGNPHRPTRNPTNVDGMGVEFGIEIYSEATAMPARFIDSYCTRLRLRCPCCGSPLSGLDSLTCSGVVSHSFRRIEGVPVLLNPDRSMFRDEDFRARAATTFKETDSLARRIGRLLPSPSRDVSADRCLRWLADELCSRPDNCRGVLIVGSGDGSARYRSVQEVDGVSILETDVSLAGGAKIVCDASDLPFEDESFDVVICVAVLEHVLEPQRCVAEIHRVLRTDGLAYIATPFMQQVHMGEYDFTRFTRSGHRWLLRDFEEIDSGMTTGPASVFVWSVEYFLLSWTRSVGVRRLVKALTRIALGWLTWLDPLVARRTAALDGAGGFFFLGRRGVPARMSPRDMIGYYRGADDTK